MITVVATGFDSDYYKALDEKKAEEEAKAEEERELSDEELPEAAIVSEVEERPEEIDDTPSDIADEKPQVSSTEFAKETPRTSIWDAIRGGNKNSEDDEEDLDVPPSLRNRMKH